MDHSSATLPTERLHAFNRALQDHLAGRHGMAEAQYRAILDADPGHAASLHFLGVLRHQQGHSAEGTALVQESLTQQPEHADWHNTLGNMLAAQSRNEEAVAAFMAALERDAHHAHAWNNLGAVLMTLGCASEAVAAFRNAIELDPAFRAAHKNLGDAYQQTGDTHAAGLSYCAEYVLRPAQEVEPYVLGIAYSQLGLYQEAAAVYSAWLADEPDNPIALHLLAASQGQAPDDRASADYLQSHFDAYADRFEHQLVDNLEYSVPVIVHGALKDRKVHAHSLRILDAGCGTGLCGPQLQPFARHLTGVDLSPKSLALAEHKAVYDSLHQQDVVVYLDACPAESWDLLVAADVLIYFGDLEPFFAAASRALVCHGHLMVSIEEDDSTQSDDTGARTASGFRLQHSGRYTHRRAYVSRALSAAGFDLEESIPIVIRKELGLPVQGLLLVARKMA